VSTFNVRLPRWFEAMVFDINIHLPHHLSPAMPWYHLRTANQALRRAFPGYVQERRLSLRALREMWKRPVLERAGDHYVPTSNG
jgi:omega-6 fatty acid desaturase (delta-12 desaturase)